MKHLHKKTIVTFVVFILLGFIATVAGCGNNDSSGNTTKFYGAGR